MTEAQVRTIPGAAQTGVARVALLLGLALLLLAAPASAQESTVSPNADQVHLNETGIDAMIAGDFEGAIGMFEQSLALGELNVTYLNLGRAHAKLGQCGPAAEAFARVQTTPVVDDPPQADVLEVLARYEEELRGECMGTLTLRCDQAEVEVSIDGGPREPCTAEPRQRAAGPVTLVAYLGSDQGSSQTVEITPKGDVQVILLVETQTVELPPVQRVEPDLFAGTRLWFWGVAGAGTAMLATALIIEVAALGPEIDDYKRSGELGQAAEYAEHRDSIQSLQSVNTVLYVGGSALLLAGVALALFYPEEPYREGATNDAGATSLWLAHDGAGLAWGTRW